MAPGNTSAATPTATPLFDGLVCSGACPFPYVGEGCDETFAARFQTKYEAFQGTYAFLCALLLCIALLMSYRLWHTERAGRSRARTKWYRSPRHAAIGTVICGSIMTLSRGSDMFALRGYGNAYMLANQMFVMTSVVFCQSLAFFAVVMLYELSKMTIFSNGAGTMIRNGLVLAGSAIVVVLFIVVGEDLPIGSFATWHAIKHGYILLLNGLLVTFVITYSGRLVLSIIKSTRRTSGTSRRLRAAAVAVPEVPRSNGGVPEVHSVASLDEYELDDITSRSSLRDPSISTSARSSRAASDARDESDGPLANNINGERSEKSAAIDSQGDKHDPAKRENKLTTRQWWYALCWVKCEDSARARVVTKLRRLMVLSAIAIGGTSVNHVLVILDRTVGVGQDAETWQSGFAIEQASCDRPMTYLLLNSYPDIAWLALNFGVMYSLFWVPAPSPDRVFEAHSAPYRRAATDAAVADRA